MAPLAETPDDDDGDVNIKLVQNELLCYAFTYIDSCSPDMLINAIEKFYDNQEIHEAKDILWHEYGSILDTTKDRRRSCVRTAASAEAIDIILKGVLVVKDLVIDCHVQFCAVNLQRLPRFSPEEVNLQSLVSRVATLELHMQQVRDQAAHNGARITAVEAESHRGAGDTIVC